MLFKRKLQVVALGVSILTVTACSSTGTGANSANTAAGANDQVVTSGLGENGGLSNPNAMIPGANQVYYFDYDQSTVHASDMPSIKVQGKYLMSHPGANILISGNTDSRGSREYNIALGQRRADAVADILELQGVSKEQIRTLSYGAEKPVALGNDEASYAQNRRDDLVYQAN